MKIFLVSTTLLMATQLSGLAFAGNDAGHGGDAVVCFSIPVSQALREGVITSAGRASIISAETGEYFRIRNSGNVSGFLTTLKEQSYPQVMSALLSRFDRVPAFRKKLDLAYKEIGDVENGFGSPTGLVDINDEGLKFPPGDNCAYAQAVIMTDFDFNYDRAIYSHFDNVQKGMMQLHEMMYYLGRKKYRHTDSLPTQMLISIIIGRDLSDNDFLTQLDQRGWGKYLTVDMANEIVKLVQGLAISFAGQLEKIMLDLKQLEDSKGRILFNNLDDAFKAIRPYIVALRGAGCDKVPENFWDNLVVQACVPPTDGELVSINLVISTDTTVFGFEPGRLTYPGVANLAIANYFDFVSSLQRIQKMFGSVGFFGSRIKDANELQFWPERSFSPWKYSLSEYKNLVEEAATFQEIVKKLSIRPVQASDIEDLTLKN